MNNQASAVARGKAALNEFQEAKLSGNPGRIGAAKAALHTARRDIVDSTAEKSAFDSMKDAMGKGVTTVSLSKASGGRPAGIPFQIRR